MIAVTIVDVDKRKRDIVLWLQENYPNAVLRIRREFYYDPAFYYGMPTGEYGPEYCTVYFDSLATQSATEFKLLFG